MSDLIPNASVPSGVPAPSEPPPSESIFQTWVKALTRPSEQTYAEIAASPNARVTTAFIWYFIASLVAFFLTFLVSGWTGNQLFRELGAAREIPTAGAASSITTAICGAPIAAVISAVSFAIFLGIMHWIAKAFGGRGTFDQLAYTIAAINAPLLLITGFLNLGAAIPLVGLCFTVIGLAISLAGIVFQVIAVKGIYQISWTGALVASLVLPIALVICLACVTIAALMALGPVIGNTFSSINQSLQNVP